MSSRARSQAELLQKVPELMSRLAIQPESVLADVHNALRVAQHKILTSSDPFEGKETLCPKVNVHPRISLLFNVADYVKPNISSIRSDDQGHFIQAGTALQRAIFLFEY